MIIFASLKKFRRLWIHLKKKTDKHINKQTKCGGFQLTNATAITMRRQRNAVNSKIAELENLLLC